MITVDIFDIGGVDIPIRYKNPFNYIGGKYKLLDQILPLFPDKISTFFDMFGGGGEMSFNVNADKIIYNEKNTQLVNILRHMDASFVAEVEKVILDYGLSKTNKEAFDTLRDYYNENLYDKFNREQAVVLYALLSHAFNYQIGFNSKSKYNMPAGTNRSYFSPNLKYKLEKYIKRKNELNIDFINNDFLNININDIPKDAFIYADPPYLITVGAYERDYFCKWSEEYEKKLLAFLDELNNRGFKFALSNVLTHKGKENTLLIEWSKKYNVHHLSFDYSNCNYQTNSKDETDSDEVLITNY